MSIGIDRLGLESRALLLTNPATLNQRLNFHEIYSSAKWDTNSYFLKLGGLKMRRVEPLAQAPHRHCR